MMKSAMTLFLLVLSSPALAQGASEAGESASNCDAEGGSYSDVITRFESGGRLDATNDDSTATGKYQFLYGTLAELGYIEKSASNQPPPGAGEWSNVVWTGQDGIHSRADFMASEAAQNAALDRFTQNNLTAISGTFTEGQIINGIPMTSGGAAAAAHMLGSGGFNKWAASGFSAAGLDAGIAAAHGMTPEEYNNHLMKRVAAGGCFDPGDIKSSGGAMEDIPAIFLMPFGEGVARPRVGPGQLQSLL
jgi:hypothetical protein